MITERQAAIRLLKLMMAASVVLPAVLFTITAWLDYHNFERLTNERIERSLDVLHEHSLKVLQTAERTFGEVNEIVRGMSDDEIRANETTVHQRLKAIVATMPRMQGVVIIDRHGRPLAFSNNVPVSKTIDFADIDYFRAVKGGKRGTYISTINTQRVGGQGKFISLSQARSSDDGKFNGIISIAVLTSYFENFYTQLSGVGSFFALVRSDGHVLARYPVLAGEPIRLDPHTELRMRIGQGLDRSTFWAESPTDHVERLLGYRKIAGFPLYAVAGVERSAIIHEWVRYNINYLIFGLPLTAFLFLGLGLALRRTQRLYDEYERRETAERALRHAQRLEAIGQLTGGVAHDFNNLLMVVGGNTQRLRKELTDPKHLRLLDMIATATQRGETLTRQLLAYSRRQTLAPQVVNLSQRLPAIREVLARSLRADIAIKVDVPNGACAVKVDPGEFELAILNLAVNAKDAMPNCGTLSIRIKPVVLKGEATADGLAGDFVAIRVADTGVGMPPDVLARVFEPFFTTKEIGRGTGLGLSQVYGFAKQSGGTATASSTEGRGTTVTIYLPRCHEAPEVAAPPAQAQAPADMIGTVLLVEDNTDVAEVGAGYLRQLGYRVRNVANAQAALASLRMDADVDLVFTDILMPGGMNGVELAREIGARFPDIPVLLTTGYSASAQEAVRQGLVLLQKPYDLDSLKRHIHEAIEGVTARARRAAPAMA